jgi:hypothetical protein
MVVIEEVVFAHCTHIGADALAQFAFELLQRDSFPFRGGLDNLSIEWMLVAIVGDVKLDRRARAGTVEHVVDAAFHIHYDRHFNHHQVQLGAKVVLDVALEVENRLPGFSRREQRVLIGR